MKVKYTLLFLVFTLCYTTAFSQKKITWKKNVTQKMIKQQKTFEKNYPQLRSFEQMKITEPGK